MVLESGRRTEWQFIIVQQSWKIIYFFFFLRVHIFAKTITIAATVRMTGSRILLSIVTTGTSSSRITKRRRELTPPPVSWTPRSFHPRSLLLHPYLFPNWSAAWRLVPARGFYEESGWRLKNYSCRKVKFHFPQTGELLQPNPSTKVSTGPQSLVIRLGEAESRIFRS